MQATIVRLAIAWIAIFSWPCKTIVRGQPNATPPRAVADQPQAPASSDDKLTPERALIELKKLGGVLVHYDDRMPGRPVVMLDLINHPNFRDSWARYFPAFPHLRQAALSGTALTDAGLEPFQDIAELDALFLADTRVTDAGLAKLAACKKLRMLDVSGTRVTPAGIAALRRALPQLEIIAEPQQLAAAGGDAPANAAPQVKRFTAQEIRRWRERLTELGRLPADAPDGWSKSRVDPAKLLSVFPELRLREGHVLRAYVFKENGNSNGFVWALPADAEFPEPKDCPRVESHFLNPPKPFDALDDVMEALAGDDSPESYLHASILRREFKEFGAGWHGVKWGMNTVLDASPWQGPPPADDEPALRRPRSAPREWTWQAPQPATWSPEVRLEPDVAIVTFYSYTPLAEVGDDGEMQKERIYRHTDTYRRGKYRPRVVERKLAEGPNMIVH